MRTKKKKVAELVADPANVRKHSARNLDAIAGSLKRFGQQKPVVVTTDGVVVAGNGTIEAARSLGWDEVAVVETDLEGAEVTSFAIADNRTAELAEWDEGALAETLEALRVDGEADELSTGFSGDEIDAIIREIHGEPEIVEDEIPENVEPVTKPGDLWKLGRHRLLCGDSTNAKDVARLMAGVTPSLMVTDPPYGVAYEGGQANANKRKKLVGDDNTEVFGLALDVASEIMPVGAWYIWHAGRYAEPVYKAIRSNGFDVRALIIWNKLKAHYGAPSAHYCQKHEPCLYAVRGSAGFCGASNEVTVWDIEQPHRNEHHPTQKPIICMSRAIKNHDADTVFDPFLGSGTTLIAAEQLDRRCFGMEIDPAYCDVIVERWENLTGEKAERIEGGGE